MNKIDLNDLILFKDFNQDETVAKAVSLFSSYKKEDFISVQKKMISTLGKNLLDITLWKNYIIKLLVQSENAFSIGAEKGEYLQGTKIWELANLELAVVHQLYHMDFESLLKKHNKEDASVTSTQNLTNVLPTHKLNDKKRLDVSEILEDSDNSKSVQGLYTYFNKYGCGKLENYYFFQWKQGLKGIDQYDDVKFENLIGYDLEKQKLIENTEFLISGRKAANVLLYGDSGTGKSSSVKALMSVFGNRGLKIISVDKDQIKDIPEILDFTNQRGCKFIFYIDDLSFEENEIEYKQFKSILEGNVKSRSTNSAIYVTSNRRNIVREVWSEREGSDDIHLRDTLQEKKSLSDRFGLIITYSSPNKDEFLSIVSGLAEKESIEVTDQLKAEAMKWDVRRGSRSGRSAKYFIDYYTSKFQDKMNKE